MADKCMRVGCTKDAVVAIRVRVPAIGHADSDGMLNCILPLKACPDCFAIATVEEILSHDFMQAGTVAATSAGKAPPDFTRAVMDSIPLAGDDYKKYEQALKRATH